MLTAKIFPDKTLCFQPEDANIILISLRKRMLWCSLEAPRLGASNEYPQHMFSLWNKKNIFLIALLNLGSMSEA